MWSSNSTAGYISRENENTLTQKDIWIPMFIAALFTIAKIWKHKCLFVDEWVKKMWSRNTMEYYSAIRKEGILPFPTTYIDFEHIMLSEISLRKISTLWYHPYVEFIKAKFVKQTNPPDTQRINGSYQGMGVKEKGQMLHKGINLWLVSNPQRSDAQYSKYRQWYCIKIIKPAVTRI